MEIEVRQRERQDEVLGGERNLVAAELEDDLREELDDIEQDLIEEREELEQELIEELEDLERDIVEEANELEGDDLAELEELLERDELVEELSANDAV